MILSNETGKQILNLRTSDRINKDIADRQFNVIVKAFNHLLQPGNDYIYIADEVGLGKTYIAMGIATLLQHFSSNYNNFIGCILVPKKNLQTKWRSEFNRFIRKNYISLDNRVKSAIGMQIAQINDEQIHDRLEIFNNNVPAYHIFRNSSFSMSSSSEMDKWKESMLVRLHDQYKSIFEEGWKYLKKEYEEELEFEIRKLYAYLLNISTPEIDILIVDEAHNFRHGIGEDTSYRNNVTSRFLGVVREDKLIFNKFPELKYLIKRKAKKVIFLSATPINKSLTELKNQIDCFVPGHQFTVINQDKLEDEISKRLNSFLIRGLMSLQLDKNKSITRNQYRHEHRNGNIVCSKQPSPQKMKDGLEALITGLVQYKTLRELNEKPNASFEIGMLAGFETFSVRQNGKQNVVENNKNDREYEDSSDRSGDEGLIKKLNDSYFNKFKTNLPHPKQDMLIEELLKRMKECKKSLVFVNRIASADEIESKLLEKYEDYQVSKIKGIKKLNNSKVNHMIRLYVDKRSADDLAKTLSKVAQRVYRSFKDELSNANVIDKEKRADSILLIRDHLLELYEGDYEGPEIDSFRDEAKSKINYQRFGFDFQRKCCDLINKHYEQIQKKGDDPDNEFEDEKTSYFFTDYFSTGKHNRYPGKNFRKIVYDKDWFEINIAVIEHEYNLGFHKSSILKDPPRYDEKVNLNRDISKFNYLAEKFVSNCNSANSELSTVHEDYLKRTFLTDLLSTELKREFSLWLEHLGDNKRNSSKLNEELEKLSEVLKGVFRNGSGLLPCYLTSTLGEDFESNFISLLKAHYPEVLDEIRTILNDYELLSDVNFSNPDKIQDILKFQSPVLGISGAYNKDVSRVAAQFRMPGFPYVLVTTDILKEGEDLHTYCKDVYHYGIAWTPSDMEQRTGRIDRIGSLSYREILKKKDYDFDNMLQVFFPYLADTLEINQVAKVFHDMNEFIKKFHDFAQLPDVDREVKANEIVNSIPDQIKKELKSIYDIDRFTPKIIDHTPLQILDPIGKSRKDVETALQNVNTLLEKKFSGLIKLWELDDFHIKGDIRQNSRRWPLSFKVVNSTAPGNFDLEVASIVCRRSDIKTDDFQTLINEIEVQRHFVIILNGIILLQDKINLFVSTESIIDMIIQVCSLADYLEFKYTKKDDSNVDFDLASQKG